MLRIIFFFFLLSIAMPALAVETPETAMSNIQRAIDTNDSGMLEKYVDMGGIIRKGVDAFVSDFAAHPPGGEGDPLLEMLSGGLTTGDTQSTQTMKALLAQETRKFVVWGVASGNFSGRPSTNRNLPDGGILSALFADASVARKELRAVKVTPPKNDTTKASAKLYDHGSERSYPVEMMLKQQPQGYWKVVDVTNLSALIASVRKEADR